MEPTDGTAMRKNIELRQPAGRSLLAVEWEHQTGDPGSVNRPNMLLLSDAERVHEWNEFGQVASEHWRVIAICNVSAYGLLQAVWAIGEPVAVCTNGHHSGKSALHAQSIAPGAMPLVALIDFEPQERIHQPPARVAIIRGRQSKRLSHKDAVKSRQLMGDGCDLVEIENCGDNAAASCPSEFEAAISWLWLND